MTTLKCHQRIRLILHSAVPFEHKTLLLALHDHYDYTRPAKPIRASIDRLAAMLGRSARTVARWMKALRSSALKILRWESEQTSGRCARYWIDWSALAEVDRVTFPTPVRMAEVSAHPCQDGIPPSVNLAEVTPPHPCQIGTPPLTDTTDTPVRMADEEASQEVLEENSSSLEAISTEQAPTPEPIPMPPAEETDGVGEEETLSSEQKLRKLPINEAFKAAGLSNHFSMQCARALYAADLQSLEAVLILSSGRGSLIGQLKQLAREPFVEGMAQSRADALVFIKERRAVVQVADRVDTLLSALGVSYDSEREPKARGPRRLWHKPDATRRRPKVDFYDDRMAAGCWLDSVSADLEELYTAIKATPGAGRAELRAWLEWRTREVDLALEILDERTAGSDVAQTVGVAA